MKKRLHISLLLLALLFMGKAHAQLLNVCEGDSIRLSTAILNIPAATGVEWFKDNVLISTDTAFVITQPGVYTLRCTGTGACTSEFSQPLTVKVDSLTAVNDSSYTRPSTTVEIHVLHNDISACYPVDTPSLTVTQQGHHGTAVDVGGGTFKYIPDSGFVGMDTFYYVVNDINGNPSNIAMVIVSINSNNPLPMVLGDFEAVKVEDESHLYWNTYSTSNASDFEIERSGDGKNFEFKGKVLAPTNSTDSTGYNYWDKSPLAGKNYYRLKLVELDGTYNYSVTRLVNFADDNPVKIYQIPAQENITVDLGIARSNISKIIILDVTGREVIRKPVTTTATTIDLKSITSGTYYIRLIDNNNSITEDSYKFNKVQ
jgi:hypothetical protein